MDFITNSPESQGYDAILVMVERFAKLAHMVLIVGTATVFVQAPRVAKSDCAGLRCKVHKCILDAFI
jgi:hypothetical protein